MIFDSQWLDRIKGFLDPDEGECLYSTALMASHRGPCLEIGTYCGKSTIYIGAACKENKAILFTVDHHRGSEEQQPGEGYFDPALFDYRHFRFDTFGYFRRTIEAAALEDTVVPIVSSSLTAARAWATPLSFVFIDGGHTEEAAFTDYTSWSPHVMPGGYLLIHDIFENPEEGGQAPYHIYTAALDSGFFKPFDRVKTLGVLQRLP